MIALWLITILMTTFILSPLSNQLKLIKSHRSITCSSVGLAFLFFTLIYPEKETSTVLTFNFSKIFFVNAISNINLLLVLSVAFLVVASLANPIVKTWEKSFLYLFSSLSLGILDFYLYAEFFFLYLTVISVFKKIPKVPYLSILLLLQVPVFQLLARQQYGYDAGLLFLGLSVFTFVLWELIKKDEISSTFLLSNGVILIGLIGTAPLVETEVGFLKAVMLPMLTVLLILFLGKNYKKKFKHILIVLSIYSTSMITLGNDSDLPLDLFLFFVMFIYIQSEIFIRFKNLSKNYLALIIPVYLLLIPLPISIFNKYIDYNLIIQNQNEFLVLKLIMATLTVLLLVKGSINSFDAFNKDGEEKPTPMEYAINFTPVLVFIVFQYLPFNPKLTDLVSDSNSLSVSGILIWSFMIIAALSIGLFSADKPIVKQFFERINYLFINSFSLGFKESKKITISIPNFKFHDGFNGFSYKQQNPKFKIGLMAILVWFLVFITGAFFV